VCCRHDIGPMEALALSAEAICRRFLRTSFHVRCCCRCCTRNRCDRHRSHPNATRISLPYCVRIVLITPTSYHTTCKHALEPR
jgi:hypothetical protein